MIETKVYRLVGCLVLLNLAAMGAEPPHLRAGAGRLWNGEDRPERQPRILQLKTRMAAVCRTIARNGHSWMPEGGGHETVQHTPSLAEAVGRILHPSGKRKGNPGHTEPNL